MTDAITMTSKWLPMEASDMVHKVRMSAEKEEMPFGFASDWAERNDEHYYYSMAYFVPPDVPKGTVSLGMVGFDPEYLRNTCFPAAMTDVLTSKNRSSSSDARP